MTTRLESFAQWLENQAVGFTIGTNLFVGFIPPKRPDGTDPPARCVTLLENAGGAIDINLRDRVDKAVQVLTRAENYDEAHADALTIFDLIHGTQGLSLPEWEAASGMTYVAMLLFAYGVPMSLGREEGSSFFFFSTNYKVMMRDGPVH